MNTQVAIWSYIEIPLMKRQLKNSCRTVKSKCDKPMKSQRLEMLEKCSPVLKNNFSDARVDVYLVGSIVRPYQFRRDSDIDIVLKGFSGDRFEVWTKLEKALNRSIEIILFETCPFQDYVVKYGLKVI